MYTRPFEVWFQGDRKPLGSHHCEYSDRGEKVHTTPRQGSAELEVMEIAHVRISRGLEMILVCVFE